MNDQQPFTAKVGAWMKFIRHHPSTLVAFAIWGTAGFMAQPAIASFLVHFFMIPLMLWATIWLAHWEGRRGMPDDD